MIDELLKLLALIITPDWGALIVLLPLFIAPLVLLWFFATGWWLEPGCTHQTPSTTHIRRRHPDPPSA